MTKRFDLRGDVIWELVRTEEHGASWRPYARVDAYPALVSALRAVLEWREGPEGPDMLFAAGAKMLIQVREALALAEET